MGKPVIIPRKHAATNRQIRDTRANSHWWPRYGLPCINQSIADDPAYLAALQREARLAARLDHPNITTVHDFQIEDGTPYIVMEYIPDALDRHLQGGTRLPWQRATEIAVQIARALQHAHDQGVVHRDIKPQNILLVHKSPIFQNHLPKL